MKPRFFEPFAALNITRWFIIPVLITLGLMVLAGRRGPFWTLDKCDPDYAYLFNSLSLAVGQGVTNADHPGTTLQEWGALVLRLRHPRLSRESFIEAVLRDPESHLKLIQLTLILLIALATAWMGIGVYQVTGSGWAAICAESVLLFCPTLTQYAQRVSPDALVAFFSLLLAGASVRALAVPAKASPYPLAIFCGLGIVTKITFAPLLIIPLFLLDRQRERWKFLMFTLVVVAISILPAADRMLNTLQWYGQMLIHEGKYGQGARGFVDRRFFEVFGSMREGEWGFICLALGSFAENVRQLFLRRQGRRPDFSRRERLFLGVSIAQVLQIAMICKQPETRYFIPAMALVGIQLGWLVAGVAARGVVWKIALVLTFFAWLWTGVRVIHTYDKESVRAVREAQEINELIQKKKSGCRVIEYSGASSPAYAASFGVRAGSLQFGPTLEKIYSPRWFLHYFGRSLYSWTATDQKLELLYDLPGCVLFRGSSVNGKFFPPWLTLKPLYHKSAEALYEWDREIPHSKLSSW